MRFLAALLLLVGFAGEASAHASLAFAEPRDGTVLTQPPKTVPEGLESVVTLGQSQEWLTPPDAKPGLGDCL